MRIKDYEECTKTIYRKPTISGDYPALPSYIRKNFEDFLALFKSADVVSGRSLRKAVRLNTEVWGMVQTIAERSRHQRRCYHQALRATAGRAVEAGLYRGLVIEMLSIYDTTLASQLFRSFLQRSYKIPHFTWGHLGAIAKFCEKRIIISEAEMAPGGVIDRAIKEGLSRGQLQNRILKEKGHPTSGRPRGRANGPSKRVRAQQSFEQLLAGMKKSWTIP